MKVDFNMSYKEKIINDIASSIEYLKVQPILFIGSGLSQRYLNAPTWGELMEILVNKCPKLTKKFAYYKQNNTVDGKVDYLAMASKFVSAYQEWAWETENSQNEEFPNQLFEADVDKDEYLKQIVSNIFREITNKMSLDQHNLSDEIEALKMISPHAIITTNYDGMLENIFPNYQKFLGDQVIRANYTMYGEILKIHGCYQDHKSLIITTEDYENFIQKKKYLSAKLLTYFAEHPLFFFGYSCSDPNIINILVDIDEILAPQGELIPNIYFVVYEKDFSENKTYSPEILIPINSNKSVRIKCIYASSFEWVYKAISNNNTSLSINPKLLRSLLDRTYKLVSSDIPKRDLPFNFEALLNNISEDEEELPKLFGLAKLNDGEAFNANYKYLLTQVAQKLNLGSWHKVQQLIDKIKNDKGVDLKQNQNKYHSYIKTSKKTGTHKYSDAAIVLLKKVQNNENYELDI